MYRLTTDAPKDNHSTALNLFYVQNGETMVRGGGPAPDYPDVTLDDYIRRIAEAYHIDLDKGADSDEALHDVMYELLFDGIDTLDGIVATLYAAGWAFASLREKLKRYEDTGLEPTEVADMKHRMDGLEK